MVAKFFDIRIVTLLLTILVPGQCLAEWISGYVLKVDGGDLITVMIDSRDVVKIRLHGIDAPEEGQNFSEAARTRLLEKVGQQYVQVNVAGVDRHRQKWGIVWIGGKNVNRWLVEKGLAWWHREYAPDSGALAKAEGDARAQRLGIWTDENPMSPWVYRMLKKENSRAEKRKARAGEKPGLVYWLNIESNSRHNSSCRWFGATAGGRVCGPDEGEPCRQCGG